MHGLSARAEIRGKRATKNIRKVAFPEVLFGLLACTNRSFLLFYEVFFGLLPSTNRMFYALPDACYHPFNQYAPEHPIFEKRT